MYCRSCGKHIQESDYYCYNCGSKVINILQDDEEQSYTNNNMVEKIEAEVLEKVIKKSSLKKINNNTIEDLKLVNFERKNRKNMFLGSLIGLFIIICPEIFEINNMNGGYAISLIGVLIMLSCFFGATLIYSNRVKVLDSLIAGENVLAYWTYSTKEWQAFKKKEYAEIKETNKGMLILMIIIISIVFLPFIIFSDVGGIMFIISLVIIGILSLAAVLSTASYKKIEKDGFVIITKDSLLMNKELHFWKGLGGAVRSVGYCAENPFMLEINYSIRYYRRTQSICTVMVPIPKGEEETAAKIIVELNKNIRL